MPPSPLAAYFPGNMSSISTLEPYSAPQWSLVRRRKNQSGQTFPRWDVGTTDEEALPGEPITSEVMARKKSKDDLLDVVAKLFDHGLSWDFNSEGKISFDSTIATFAFIRNLDDRVALPQISPDGEGGVMMIWEKGQELVSVSINEWKINTVKAAATPEAEYIPDISFDGQSIPPQVLQAIVG